MKKSMGMLVGFLVGLLKRKKIVGAEDVCKLTQKYMRRKGIMPRSFVFNMTGEGYYLGPRNKVARALIRHINRHLGPVGPLTMHIGLVRAFTGDPHARFKRGRVASNKALEAV